MDNEKFVRSVYQITEDMDIPQLGVLGHLDAALER